MPEAMMAVDRLGTPAIRVKGAENFNEAVVGHFRFGMYRCQLNPTTQGCSGPRQ